MSPLIKSALLLAVIAPWALAQDQQTIRCGEGNNCPEEFPCCSREYSTTDCESTEVGLTPHQNMANAVLARIVWEDVIQNTRTPSNPAYLLRYVRAKITPSGTWIR